MKLQIVPNLLLSLYIMVSATGLAQTPETLSFPSTDGLELTADLYLLSETPETPFIVLFHQAGSSRGEYTDIAPRLNELGYNALALDARSGGSSNGVGNETAQRAGGGASYLDAAQDLEAALSYVKETYASITVIAWGSSYSASLTLYLAGTKPDLLSGVLAFSPGEYFAAEGQTFIEDAATSIEIPVFITSASSEEKDWRAMFDGISSASKTGFIPNEGGGRHGSSTLFASTTSSELYWQAVEAFLGQHFPVVD